MILHRVLNGHQKEFVIKAFAKFMTRARRTEVPLIRGLWGFRPTYSDKRDVGTKTLHTHLKFSLQSRKSGNLGSDIRGLKTLQNQHKI